MDPKLWHDLPSELREHALTFLSIPALFRLRTVCRRWNDIIRDPSFLHRATQEFVVARWAVDFNGEEFDEENHRELIESEGYSFLDVHSKRWYTIWSWSEPPLLFREVGDAVAMDGGLVCDVVLEEDDGIIFFLANPVGNEIRRLPLPLTIYNGNVKMKVDMVVAERASTIFLMPGEPRDDARYPPMVTYDTTSNQWRTAADLPSLPTGQESCVECSVVFGGSLYALLIPFADLDATEHWLWRYDLSSWSDTGVAIRGELADPKLMASGDSRMLLAAWKETSSGEFLYEVSKVDLERRVVEAVVSVDVERLFGVEIQDLWSVDAVSMGERVVVVWKPSGAVRIYDLRTGEWDESVPDNPVAAMEGFRKFRMWYGKAMHLNLPSSTLWIHESGDA